MATRTTNASKFYIQFTGLDAKPLPIKSVTEVSYEAKVTGGEKPLESTKQGRSNRQTSSGGFDSSPTMTVEAYLCASEDSSSKVMYNWFNQAMPTSDGGSGDWAGSRRSGSVIVYDPDGKTEILRWNFFNAWVKTYSITDADCTGGELAVESYEFVCEKIVKQFSKLGS
ncbi:phage tail protein [Spirulina subsalsa FACHB-351]|uniref:Phage tail protein n=1 Tax=Spirulina subsalsa FACHB-351 TaxID=234711 RepID=A0ABT3L9C3_9CYAN|nr:phage tail protein [Spirulina subsalsa]MCW6038099.1 phage tail protein [Spirulina subsalsa FACHB-351]